MNYGLIISCLLLLSCTSSNPLIQKNPGDESVRFYAKRVDNGKPSKTKHLKGLEMAYQSASSFDWYLVDSLQKLDGNAHWPAINQVHRRIKVREEKIAGLLPLVSKEGYVPVLVFTPGLSDIEKRSREKAADYLYARGVTQLDMAKSGNRLIARESFATFSDLQKNYSPDWADANARMEEAAAMGTTYFLVETTGWQFNGSYFWDAFFMRGANLQDSKWQVYDLEPVPGRHYHYRLELNIDMLDPGMESRIESTNTYTKEVQVDEIVKRDSSGNVIERTPVMGTVTAIVSDLTISKYSSATLSLHLIDNEDGSITAWQTFSDYNQFLETSCTISGDQRAVPGITCNTPSPFGAPDDWSVVRQMGSGIRQQIEQYLWLNAGNL